MYSFAGEDAGLKTTSDWINEDDDSFYIQVENLPKTTLSSSGRDEDYLYVNVRTVGRPYVDALGNKDYSCYESARQVVLKRVYTLSGAATNKFNNKDHRFILVSDAADDATIPVNGVGNQDNKDNVTTDPANNDRTYRIQLGGRFRVEVPSVHGKGIEVKRKKTITVNVFILKDRDGELVISEDAVESQWRVVRERYAQVGVRIDWKITVVEPLAGREGLVDTLIMRENNSSTVLHQNAKDMIDGIVPANKRDGVYCYYVKKLVTFDDVTGAEIPLNGSAIAKWAYPNDIFYHYNIFMSLGTIEDEIPDWGFIAAHELAHCVGNLTHNDGYRWMLMYKNPTGYSNHLGTKRFTLAEEVKIHNDPHAK